MFDTYRFYTFNGGKHLRLDQNSIGKMIIFRTLHGSNFTSTHVYGKSFAKLKATCWKMMCGKLKNVNV